MFSVSAAFHDDVRPSTSSDDNQINHSAIDDDVLPSMSADDNPTNNPQVNR